MLENEVSEASQWLTTKSYGFTTAARIMCGLFRRRLYLIPLDWRTVKWRTIMYTFDSSIAVDGVSKYARQPVVTK